MSGTISTSATRIEALVLQSSAYGVTLPLVYGVARIPGNLLWYGAFKATAHTTSSGKGGVSQENTTYTYSASVMMGLCEGQITGVSRVWRGKKLFSGGVLPGQLPSAVEGYTVPAIGGTYTVTQAATFAANIGVTATDGYGNTYPLAEAVDYKRVGAAYSFGVAWNGFTVAVKYQYISGGGTQSALQQAGLSLATGALAQPVWAYLNTYTPPGGTAGSQAVGYSGLALVYAQDYLLSGSASVDNHSFEVQGPQAWSVSTSVPDANPCTVTMDVLANGRYGANFPSAQLGSVVAWSNYCLAAGLLVSPAIDTQLKAADLVTLMAKLTNTAAVWSSGRLKMIPYGDAALTGNGATYTPNVTPVYDLTDDDYIAAGGDPVRVVRKPQASAYNHVRVEFLNRASNYNVEIAEAKDSANIDINGLRSDAILKAHWICDAGVARKVAQLLLQRALYVRNTYEFSLGWSKALLEPMDLVTLTDSALGYTKLPVRITDISEADDGGLKLVAEEFALGVAGAALYPSQAGAGFLHDYNVAPGNALAPVIFESPGALTTTGLELCVATTSANPNWGGCQVWASYDGTTYLQLGAISGGSRYGTVTGPVAGGSVPVLINTGQLLSGSAADLAALGTLCLIGGATPEWMAYQTATLTGALAYTLSTLSQGAYDTAAALHLAGDPFVRFDEGVARSGPLDPALIGKTVYIKLCSFNLYRGAQQSLADVSAYSYVISGAFQSSRGGVRTFRQEAAPLHPHDGDLWIKPSTGVQTRWATATAAWESAATVGATLGTNLVDGYGTLLAEGRLKNNLIDASWWKPGAVSPWNNNQGSATVSDAWLSATMPDGSSQIVWQASTGAGDGAVGGGGWNPGGIGNQFVPDVNKTYMFVCFQRHVSGSGTGWWGAQAYSVCDLNTAMGNANPYWAGGFAAPVNGRWYMYVGWVFPAGSSGMTNGLAGVWDCATGALAAAGTNFCWSAAATVAGTRAYQFYAASGVHQFARPQVYLCDGSEPSVDALLAGGKAYTAGTTANWAGVTGVAVTTGQIQAGAVTGTGLSTSGYTSGTTINSTYGINPYYVGIWSPIGFTLTEATTVIVTIDLVLQFNNAANATYTGANFIVVDSNSTKYNFQEVVGPYVAPNDLVIPVRLSVMLTLPTGTHVVGAYLDGRSSFGGINYLKGTLAGSVTTRIELLKR